MSDPSPSPTASSETGPIATVVSDIATVVSDNDLSQPGADARFHRHGVDWWIDDRPIPYPLAVAAMEARVEAIRAGDAPETVWLLQHPPLYTAGTSARPQDLIDPERFPVYQSGRGGQFTYHGPGQRIAYVMLDLKRRQPDVRVFVRLMEEWVIATLARFGVVGEHRTGRVGIWVSRGIDGRGRPREDKIAAIGVRLKRWVSYHGLALNVEPDLSHFGGIVPCGIGADTGGIATGVTSLVALGHPVSMVDADMALIDTFAQVFANGGPPEASAPAPSDKQEDH